MGDHLLVVKGNGVVKDFPGNYTQYREWCSMKSKDEASTAKKTVVVKENRHSGQRRRMTYMEKKEYAKLEEDIAALEAERKQLEEQLCSGKLTVEELTEKSKRLPLLKDELDAKEMRWLELSEIGQ